MLSPNTFRMITYRRWGEGGYDKGGKEVKCKLVLVRKTERKRPHRKTQKKRLILIWVLQNRK